MAEDNGINNPFLQSKFIKNLFEQKNGQENKSQKTAEQTLAELKTLNKHVVENTKMLVKMGTSKAGSASTAQSKTEQFFAKKEDPNKKINKNLDEIEALMAESNKLAKEKKKGSIDWMKGMAMIMGLGGLAGWFFTGKTEFLHSAAKGLLKYSPFKFIIKAFDGAFAKAIPWIGKGFKKILTMGPLKKMWPKLGKGLLNVFKPVIGLAKGIGKIFKPLGKIFGKTGMKATTKTGGKSFLKKVPFIGGLIGLFFGIQRFKKGDIFGGILEIASGLTSMIPVPVLGTALGIGIDLFLLSRDFKKSFGGEKKPKPIRKKGKIKWENLKWIPGVGIFAGIMSGISKWKSGDKKGALGEIASGIISVVPGAGLLLNGVMGLIGMFSGKDAKEKAGETMSKIGDALKNPAAAAKAIAGGAMGAAKKGAKAIGGIAKDPIGAAKSLFKKTKSKFSPGKIMGGLKSFFWSPGEEVPGILLGNENVDISGMNPDVWNNFTAMASEYKAQTGDSIQVNSAYRDPELQKKLYEADPTKAAPPGSSLHNYGYAIDMQTTDANALDRLGLFDKYGFWRPGLNWKRKETWHVEPKGIDRTAVKHIQADSPSGDPLPGIHIPPDKTKTNVPEIQLSPSTIDALAASMRNAMKGSVNIPQAPSMPIATGARD